MDQPLIESEIGRAEPDTSEDRTSERVEPPVHGERVLRAFDGLLLRVDSAIDRFLPEALNPLAQTGAIANTTFITAIVSGIVLLLWYSPSLHFAYDSVGAMGSRRFASLTRSLHRYSSDACMFFVAVHSLKLFFARRFGGARWLAWITGAFLVGTLWLVGWLGYWLVWDERARQIALGTARVLDALPIFADPLSRSFLTDDRVNSLLFFVVFFVHMLIPLAMGIALWLHITRLSRPHFLTKWRMTAWVLGSLLLMSALAPADLAKHAHMSISPERFRMDAFYLAPLGLTDRLGAGALWALLLVGGVVFYSIPWTLARGRARVAEVIESRCNACENCFKDCPYDAIAMVPRTDGRKFPSRALVDPNKCLGCGICAGSSDSAGIGLPWFDVRDRRKQMDRFVDNEQAARGGEKPFVAFVCAESAGAALSIDERTAECRELPGYRVMRVPCAGWVHALTVERAIRHGAAGVLVVACGAGDGVYREGGKWTHARMASERAPRLNLEKVDPAKVRVVELFRTDRKRLVREAKALRDGVSKKPRRARAWVWASGGLIALLFAGTTWGASRVAYELPTGRAPQLVVSFKHPGQKSETCRDLTEEEKRKTPPHMRPPKICERKRNDVRMRVSLDDRVVIEKAYAPAGIWSDGNSLAIERIEVAPGDHRVKVSIGDSADPKEFTFESEQLVAFEPHAIKVVRFDRTTGFEWR